MRQVLLDRAAAVAAGPKPGELLYIPTPWARFNKVYGGIEISVGTLLVGHTGDGKSSVLLAIAEEGSKHVETLLVSAEDPLPRTADRQLSGATGISTLALNRKDVTEDEGQRLISAAAAFPERLEVYAGPLSCDEAAALVKTWVASKRKKSKKPLLVCIDYLQALIDTSNPEQELANFVREMNGLASKEGIAVVLASQVRSDMLNQAKNRLNAAKPPPSKPPNWKDFISFLRPQLGDTEHCRRAEKATKAVLVWFRPGRWAKDLAGWYVDDDIGELHVLKANFGPTGYATLRWEGATQRVYDS